ncbi:MAG: SecDF P1 head subdomain-containing protein [Acidimicrobiales bacterium]
MGYQLTEVNLNVSTSTFQPAAAIGPDPAFAHVPSTPASLDKPKNALLFPGTAAAVPMPGARFVLGPAGLTNGDVQQASADYMAGEWLVNVTLTSAGSRAWDRLNQTQFHAYIAFVVNGVVISAPLVEPSQSTFASLSGPMQIAANFTQRSAQTLAAELQP